MSASGRAARWQELCRSSRGRALVIAVAALGVLAALAVAAPGYLGGQGFPLDDAWIHAVYGRALARHGAFQYNPGVAASGESAPLWAIVSALVHLVARAPATVVLVTKLVGFALHVAAAIACAGALADEDAPWWLPLAGGLVVLLQPDLVAAATSGMEVPLAAWAACLLWRQARAPSLVRFGGATVVAVLARPELGVVAFALPALLHAGRDRAALARALAAAAAGAALAFVVIVAIDLAGSGRPLPATFYAKVGAGATPLLVREWLGFVGIGARLPPFALPLSLVAVLAAALWVLRGDGRAVFRAAAAAALSALAYWAVSFALIAPVDPFAFYHQRYVLPVLPLLVGFVPAALVAVRPSPSRRRVAAVALAALAAWLAVAAPARWRRLANDARNIDDVQVRLGRTLAAAAPTDVAWVVDAGAARYFGNAFVVDVVGLNTPALLDDRAGAYLAAHPPRWLDLFADWSSVDDAAALPTMSFSATTPYTVTSVAAMRTHVLARCPAGRAVVYHFRARAWPTPCQ